MGEMNALRSELSWTHYRLLLRVENDQARQFYMQETIDCNWSTRSLERQIGNLYYERMLMSRNDPKVKDESIEKTNNQEPQDIIKDPYVLDFLGLKDNKDYNKKIVDIRFNSLNLPDGLQCLMDCNLPTIGET